MEFENALLSLNTKTLKESIYVGEIFNLITVLIYN